MMPDWREEYPEFLDEEIEDDESDAGEECGRWRNGRLGPWTDCLMAGTEFCDFDCPYGRAG